MARISVVLGAVVVILCTGSADARMYFLPDYQNGAYLKRVNDNSNSDDPVSTPDLRSCAVYSGFLSAEQKGNMECNIVKTFPDIGTCYSECECNPEVYPFNSSNCSYNLEGDTCIDTLEVEYYSNCHNPCDDFVDNNCGSYRCKVTYASDGCSTKCKTCYSNTCDYPENSGYPLKADCQYGCDAQGVLSGCATKCYACQTCAPNDCSGYSLSSCPANGVCESCSVGCGDSTVKYRFAQCNLGFYDKDYFICGNQLCNWSLQ